MNSTVLAWLTAALASAGLGLLLHHMFRIEPLRIAITRHRVLYPDLPLEMDGVVLCQLSDVHITATRRNAEEIARAVRSVKADLFVFTGDMVHLASGVGAFFRWFDRLGASCKPAVAVLGNAEHKELVNSQLVVEGLRKRGVTVLINEATVLQVRNGEMQIVGTDDPHTGHSDFAAAYASADPSRWTLLLCHSPDGAAEREGRRADLMLCGHTHGGQIRLPMVGAIRTNTFKVHRIVAGWYEGQDLARRAGGKADGTRLYVSRGLGGSKMYGRLMCRPELALFELRRGDVDRRSREIVLDRDEGMNRVDTVFDMGGIHYYGGDEGHREQADGDWGGGGADVGGGDSGGGGDGGDGGGGGGGGD